MRFFTVSRNKRALRAIRKLEAQFQEFDSKELRETSLALQYRARTGQPLYRLLPEAFALLCCAAERTTGLRPYDCQVLAGIALFHGMIVEMATGEGKTLTAIMPLYLRALRGKGSHIATVNDYLAERDASGNRPIFELLGLTTGVILSEATTEERREAYRCDITYGTAKEFGFDFLRDELYLRRDPTDRAQQTVQRQPYSILIDEADSVLIDDARTPLVISAVPGDAEAQKTACFAWSAAAAEQFEEPTHFEYDAEKRSVELTFAGREMVRGLARPELVAGASLNEMYDYLEKAIKVRRDFHRNQQYVIRDGEVVIVDESTGRLAEGRKWNSGIHQSVEAAEGVEITVDAGHAARVTVQDFFMRYPHLSGMTGTVGNSAREFRKVYQRSTVRIPTHRPVIRRQGPTQVFRTADEKWQAIVNQIRKLHEAGRPVLVGTRTIEISEQLSQRLSEADIPHQVLNAHRLAAEADIVSQAGQPGKVTVATNMAGRGTDIELGEGVAKLGGLYVICSELHSSIRIDRQLAGRCGRQGDPGEWCQYMALGDAILELAFGGDYASRVRQSAAQGRTGARQWQRWLRRAQATLERRHFKNRRLLLHQEKQINKSLRQMGVHPQLDSVS